MRVHLTRDSVAAGDDTNAPNEALADLPDGASLGVLASWIGEHHYPAHVYGGSTWALRLGGEGGPAVAALHAVDVPGHQEYRWEWVADPSTPLVDSEAHLGYLLGQDAALTADLIRRDPHRPNLSLERLQTVDGTGRRSDQRSTIVYPARDVSAARVLVPGAILLVVSLLLVVVAVAERDPKALLVAVAGALVIAVMLCGLRRRVVLTADRLVVQGRFARVSVPLAAVTAVHQQDHRGLVVWVASNNERPFRIYFLPGVADFVPEVRARAAACGAILDPNSDLIAKPPPDTRLFFTSY